MDRTFATESSRHLRTVLRRRFALLAMLLSAMPATSAIGQKPCHSEDQPFDNGWSLHLGEAQTNQPPAPDDAAWKAVELPNDWAIKGPRSEDNASGGAGSFAPMGVGWYRRTLQTPVSGCRRAVLRFDGVMAHSEVWVNGHSLGVRPDGYVSFEYDLSPFLRRQAGADNVILVRVDNTLQPSSRFYQGAGIDRHVHLRLMPELHTESWSTVVTTPHIDRDAADVAVTTNLVNDGTSSPRPSIKITITSQRTGAIAATMRAVLSPLAAGSQRAYTAVLKIKKPQLWDIDAPNLYVATIDVSDAAGHRQIEHTTFGVRESHFDAATGYWLNGRNLKIKGVALHSDMGALGMAVPRSLVVHRLLAMKTMGANAVRTAHNPVDPMFLDVCDELGLLVLDEFFDVWSLAKNTYDYHLDFRDWYLRDTRDTVRRDRNHPSIIAWSAGNEIRDTAHAEVAKPILASLVQTYHELDPTRPVTQALFRPNATHDYDNGFADMLDVIGQNYRPNEILAAHEAKPTRKILGTENTHDRETWLAVRDHPAYAGMFVWSGTDYLGESRHWPLIVDPSGLFDRTDYPKPDALEHESWWRESPVLYAVRRVAPTPKAPTDPGYELEQYRPAPTTFHDWTPRNQSPHTERVEVYSNCSSVRLSLNGNDLGEKDLAADAAPRIWQVAFQPGVLRAQCEEHPEVTDTLQTAGSPGAIQLTAETSANEVGFEHTALLRATVVDQHGLPVPGAETKLTFSIAGPGQIVATDNADTSYSAPFQALNRSTYDGRAVVYVRRTAAGPIHLTVEADGIDPGSLTLDDSNGLESTRKR